MEISIGNLHEALTKAMESTYKFIKELQRFNKTPRQIFLARQRAALKRKNKSKKH